MQENQETEINKEERDKEWKKTPKVQTLNILLVEDSKIDARLIQNILSQYMPHPCRVQHVETMATAEVALEKDKGIRLILLDLGLPDTKDSKDTFQRIGNIKEDTPIIILTSEHDHELAVDIVNNGAEDYVRKSVMRDNPELFCDIIDFAICRHTHIVNLKKQKDDELEEKDKVLQWVTGSYSVTP